MDREHNPVWYRVNENRQAWSCDRVGDPDGNGDSDKQFLGGIYGRMERRGQKATTGNACGSGSGYFGCLCYRDNESKLKSDFK